MESTTNNKKPSLAMQRDSRVISKSKPKIRIIHIFAPEIIKTDVENFRELVQRLTGKPTETSKPKKRTTTRRRNRAKLAQKIEVQTGFHQLELRESIKEGEDGMWVGGSQNPSESGGFLGGFADLDYGLMQELNQISVLPLDASSHMDTLGGARLA
ncbi:hypothetical protein NMG60_11003775 [Bertholletia excelsa]